MLTAIDRAGIGHRHWKAIESIRSSTVQPQDFRNKWNATNKDLSKLLGVSISYVERWFLDPSSPNHRTPEQKYCERLSEIDYILRSLDEAPQSIKDLYNKLRDKK